jgi:hypothetical protein
MFSPQPHECIVFAVRRIGQMVKTESATLVFAGVLRRRRPRKWISAYPLLWLLASTAASTGAPRPITYRTGPHVKLIGESSTNQSCRSPASPSSRIGVLSEASPAEPTIHADYVVLGNAEAFGEELDLIRAYIAFVKHKNAAFGLTQIEE